MPCYHFNIYSIPLDSFSYALDRLKDLYREFDARFPLLIGYASNLNELKFFFNSRPPNCTFLVLNSDKLSVWIIPNEFSTFGIEKLIDNCVIDLDHSFRDVGYFGLKDSLINLPVGSHFILQRYYV